MPSAEGLQRSSARTMLPNLERIINFAREGAYAPIIWTQSDLRSLRGRHAKFQRLEDKYL
jgi:hypothetical protein